MPRENMYAVSQANTNLAALANIQDINTITAAANGLLGKTNLNDATKRERRIEYFYDKMLLDTIKLGSENNVLLKYCKVKALPKGNEKFLLRRWGGLTEHTVPLAEGMPPKSDHMASESFEGTYCQYGRYMEFTDRVEFNLIDDVITHYSMELGDVAVRMAERLCREEIIANAGENYAGNKAGIHELVIGDTVGIADYRLQALKFSRRLVKPLASGNYIVICSPEHIYDLVGDPLVEKYMQNTNTAEPYVTGKPVDLFNIRFEQTMLDDYAYGYVGVSNPGEFETTSGNYAVRFVLVHSGGLHYINVAAGNANSSAVSANVAASGAKGTLAGLTIKREVKDIDLKDGSHMPNQVVYDVAGFKTSLGTSTTYTIATQVVGNTGQVTASTLTVAQAVAAQWYQLPVHRSFMFGDEFMYKTGINGEMDAKFYVKAKGSAGVLDPIDQRQSVGFKINTLGFNVVRPEAMTQFIFVPEQALATYEEVIDEYNKHYPAKDSNNNFDGGYTPTNS